MFGNDNNEEVVPVEPDSEFILRLPPEPAESLRAAIREESKHGKNRLKIQIEEDMRHANVKFDNFNFKAKIYDLPAVIESHKTLDRKVFYKVADVCQIMICEDDDGQPSGEEEPSDKKLDKDGRDKRYLYAHGISACLKNVRKKRYRKTLRKKFTEMPTVEKEVKMLLKTDAEAIHSRFEIVNVEEEKTPDKSDVLEEKSPDKMGGFENSSQKLELGEYELFGGEVSSSSEDSDEEVAVVDQPELNSSLNNNDTLYEIKEESYDDNEVGEANTSGENRILMSQQESEVAERNLGQILELQNTSNDKTELYAKLTELQRELASIQEQRQAQEDSLVHIEDFVLRQRVSSHINRLKDEEIQKEDDCAEIMMFLQHS